MAKTKNEILEAYNNLKKELKKQPSYTEFYGLSKVTSHDIKIAFGSNGFNKLVEEAGDEPKTFSTEKTELDSILLNFGSLTRELGKIPNTIDWVHHKMVPAPNNINKYHKLKWSDLIMEFYFYAKDNSDWDDIIHLFDSIKQVSSETQIIHKREIQSVDDYRNEYIPPIVENLIDLSFDDKRAMEFEEKVNITFEILGFEVKKYGQGTGRNPDGIALDRENHYAILIDAKARSDYYKIGTEDRKFIEYIEKYVPVLKKEGFKKFYFLVVSSKYEVISEKSIENILVKTQIPLSLMTSKQLLKILAFKIKKPRNFDSLKFERALSKGNLISDKLILD